MPLLASIVLAEAEPAAEEVTFELNCGGKLPHLVDARVFIRLAVSQNIEGHDPRDTALTA